MTRALSQNPLLSAAIVTYNEGHLLMECLQSIQWVDEIVIVDLGSTDNTLEVARQFTDRIISHEHVPYAEIVRNFSFEQTTSEWILLLDPDERVSSLLAKHIREIISPDCKYEALELPFVTYYFGKPILHSGYGIDYIPRVFRREAITWKPVVHFRPIFKGEVFRILYQPAVNNAVQHINYTTVAQFIEKMNRYTDNEARKIHESGKCFCWYKPFSYSIHEFVNRFLVLQGYKDGIYGFIVSLLFAVYWLVVTLKLWELDHSCT